VMPSQERPICRSAHYLLPAHLPLEDRADHIAPVHGNAIRRGLDDDLGLRLDSGGRQGEVQRRQSARPDGHAGCRILRSPWEVGPRKAKNTGCQAIQWDATRPIGRNGSKSFRPDELDDKTLGEFAGASPRGQRLAAC